KQHDSAFRGAVGNGCVAAYDAPSRTVVDDHAAALGDHRRQGELRHQERAFQVDVNLQVPFFLAAIECGVGVENAGVVEEDIEAPEGRHGSVDSSGAVSDFWNVGTQEDGFTALFEDLRGDRVSPL